MCSKCRIAKKALLLSVVLLSTRGQTPSTYFLWFCCRLAAKRPALTFCGFAVDSRPNAQHDKHHQKREGNERNNVVELVGPVHGEAQHYHQYVDAEQHLRQQQQFKDL